jgi:hypothetical protein
MNPLLALNQLDQFVWLDHINRSLITGGGLQRLIKEDGLGGLTSNPTITDAFASCSDQRTRRRKQYWRPLRLLVSTCTRSPNAYRRMESRHSPPPSTSLSRL